LKAVQHIDIKQLWVDVVHFFVIVVCFTRVVEYECTRKITIQICSCHSLTDIGNQCKKFLLISGCIMFSDVLSGQTEKRAIQIWLNIADDIEVQDTHINSNLILICF